MKELDNFRKFIQENELHEGTWSLGSPESIGSIVKGLQALINMADDAQNKKNAAGRGFVDGLKNQLKAEQWNTRLYNIVGDDSFFDHYDAAKSAAQLNDFDEVKNKLGDAIARAIELKDTILKNRELEEGEVNEIFGKKGNQRIKVSNDMKIGKALSALEDALFELNFLGVISDNDYNNFWMDKYGELYMDTMGQLDPSVQKKYDYEGLDESEGLEENDKILDEIVDESFIGDLATRIRKRRAAKKEKERFTKGLDMKDFRGQGAPEIDPEFTAGLEEEKDEE